MANPEHVKILKQGVDVWNKWREESPEIEPSLIEDYFTGSTHLTKMNLIGIIMNRSEPHANLDNTALRGGDLMEVDLSGENLKNINLRRANLIKANLSNADLSEANLVEANLSKANLNNANLKKADLRLSCLRQTNLNNADIQGSNLTRVRLNGATMTRTNLCKANLEDSDLSLADLSNANLVQAKLGKVNLFRSNLSGANLNMAYLANTKLQETILKGTNLLNAFISEVTFTNTDLSEAIGLESLHHSRHSIIDHRTLMLSKNLPEKFLQDCGLPDQLIDNLPSLLNSIEPIQFHSCFISYSSKDEEFARRLHADLQDKGIRCWYAPEDMKIGDKIRPRIDEVIHLHEKLLLVLSEDSIKSNWVEKEVETAFEKESDREENVLFPIRLDETVMDIKTGWPADIKRTRNIGDFKNWKNHDAYQKSFERLLRDLKNESG